MRFRKLGPMLGLTGLLATLWNDSAKASADDANRTLGFEQASDWTITNGTISGASTAHTQGMSSLAIRPLGYTTITSRALGPLGEVMPSLSFDLFLPKEQPNPSWLGTAQLFVSSPSLGVNNAYLGQRELTGLKPGQFHRLSFAVPNNVRTLLQGSYSDARFSIVLNVPTNAPGTYLLDNLEVSSLIPPSSTVGSTERLDILGFETDKGWSISSGQIEGSSALYTTQGNFSLGVKPKNYAVITSRPLPSLGPVAPVISFDLRKPIEQPNPNWHGEAQLLMSIPSRHVNNAFVGQKELTPLAGGKFQTLAFSLPAALQGHLNSDYTDLTFSIVLNVASGAQSTYYLDRFHVGAVTTEADTLPTTLPVKPDLVGVAHSGMVVVGLDGEVKSPALQQGTFYVEQRDRACIPTTTVACRFLVHLVRLELGPLNLGGKDLGKVTVINTVPFEIVAGGAGASSLASKIPSNVPFGIIPSGNDVVLSVKPSKTSALTVNPSNNGMIALSADFQGKVDGHDLKMLINVVADSPLVNRPPVVSAGPDQSIVATDCDPVVTLDATASVDPDGNLAQVTWFQDNTYWGSGLLSDVPLRRAGSYRVTAVGVDAFGVESRDEMQLTLTLPNSCPSSD